MFKDFFRKNFDKCIEDLKAIHKSDLDEIEKLKKVNAELSDKQYKDKELQRLQDEIEHYKHIVSQSFTINDEELATIRAWQGDHKHNSFYYKFVATAIGDSGSVVCSVCGEEFEFKEIC